MMKKAIIFLSVLFCIAAAALGAESAFETGEKLFMQNKPLEAKTQLETALVRDSSNETIYLYLGLIHQQLNDPIGAIDILRRGLLVAKNIKDKLYFVIGNNYYNQGDNTLAEKNYTLALAENSLLAAAYLNRGQALVRLVKYPEAIEDYETYLRLKPDTWQREAIEKLIALLRQSIDEQKDLLDSVLNSIKNASVNTQTESAGTEDFQDTGGTDLDIIE
ncbi:MAG: tetratricopeptide repeat protein [Spirochaetales bacterium]|nr:tetratricopeptide repeat protein [Spirochaetales bacterium]